MKTSEQILHLISERPPDDQFILLAALSVLWLTPQHPDARLLLERYRDRRFDLAALRETALQLFLIAGFQTSLEAAFQIRDVFGSGLPVSEDETNTFDAALWLARGRDLQAQVYRLSVEKLRANLDEISPELGEWTVLIGYGLVLSRPGLPPHWRELFEVAVLAAQGFPRQLHSHLLGALNLGASREEVDLTLTISEICGNSTHVAHARRIWQKISQ